MKILIRTPIYGDQRRELFTKVISYELLRFVGYIRDKGHEVIPLIIGSDEADREMAEQLGLYYTHYPNKPLGAKMNRASLAALKFDVDYLMCISSDDVVSNSVFDAVLPAMEKGVDLIGWLDFYIYDVATERAAKFTGYKGQRRGDTIGLGRCLSKRAIRLCNGKLWDDDRNKGLDGSMTRKLSKYKISQQVLLMEEQGAFLTDIKRGDNLWGFDHYSDTREFIEKENLMWAYPKMFERIEKL